MKKFYSLFLMLVTTILYSQTEGVQVREIYSSVNTMVNNNLKFSKAENIIFFEYGGKALVKFMLADGTVGLYDRTTPILNGAFKNGIKYTYATYRSQTDNKHDIIIQKFNESKYGSIVIFMNGDLIQFIKEE